MSRVLPVRLFVSDIDGCLAVPFEPFRIGRMRKLRRRARRASVTDPERPALTICSGRSYSYVEAVAQVLETRAPSLFESGAGMIDPDTMQPMWNPMLTGDLLDELETVREFFARQFGSTSGLWIHREKRTQAGLAGSPEAIAAAIPMSREFVTSEHPELLFATTRYSIDVLPKTLTKKEGLAWLSEVVDVPLAAMAFIGDADGDIGALQAAGVGFAPANAVPEVRAVADAVTTGATIDGVLEAYDWCVQHNRALIRKPPADDT